VASREQRVEALYYELDMRTQGMEAGKARADAILKDLEIVAAKSGKSIDEVAAAVNRSGGGSTGLRKIADALRGTGDNAQHASVSLHAFMRPLESLATESLSANAQVGNLASKLASFGLGTGVTLLILAGITAIAKAWDFFAESARKAKKQADELTQSLLKAAQARADQTRGGLEANVFVETAREDEAQRKVDSLTRQRIGTSLTDLVAQLQITLQLRKANNDLTDATGARLEAQQQLDDFDEKASKDAIERRKREGVAAKQLADQQRAAREGFAAAIAGQSPGSTDNFELQIQKLVETARDAHLGSIEIQKMVAQLRQAHAAALQREGFDLAQQLQGEVAKATGLQATQLIDALNTFDEKIRDAIVRGVPVDFPLVGQLRAAKLEAIELAKAADDLNAHLVQIDHRGNTNFIQSMRTLIEDLDRANADFDSAQQRGDVAGMAAAQQRINTILAAQKKLQDDIAVIIARQNDETVSLSQKLASGVAALADVAFGLVSAFAGANSELTKMIGGISQAAHGIDTLMTLANTKNANGVAPGLGGLLSTGAGLLSAAPAIGQIIGGGIALASSLFGKSPEEQARLQALKENNARLRELSTKVGDLAKINVQGTQLGQFQSFFANPTIQNLLNNPGARFQSQDAINRQVGAVLNGMGLTSQELKDFAQQFGIKVGTGTGGKITIDDLQQLFKALSSSELGQFADDFTGQMSKLDTQIKLFDLSKPIQQFEAFRKALQGVNGGAGALTNILSTFDLTTAQGIEAAKKAIQDLFNQLGSLSADQLPALLGGLTADEFRQALERLRDIVNAQAGSGGIAGTGGFNVSRTITETTGNRLEALFTTGNIFAEQTAQNTALIARLLGGSPTLISAPPTTPAGASTGTSITFESVTVEVNGVADAAQGQRVGEAVGRGFIDTVDRELGKRFKSKLRLHGVLN
jgi:hypothetical protein